MHLQRNLRLFNELELIFQAERENTRKQMSALTAATSGAKS